MNWTADQVAAAERRIAQNMNAPLPVSPPPMREEKKKLPRTANKWEMLFRDELELRRQAGEVLWYAFEPIRLKLAQYTQDGKERAIWYKPDFAALVTLDIGYTMEHMDTVIEEELVFYEVKGHWREAARVRIKMAASQYPFRFVAVTREHCEWKYEEFHRL